ncbi:MAG: hypothetical protein C5B50_06315 [Verrucomicrobia bacterium]|nr:MAG: hypothetical protein C5B50_06315 [Verrucomicrobiota bacterium]
MSNQVVPRTESKVQSPKSKVELWTSGAISAYFDLFRPISSKKRLFSRTLSQTRLDSDCLAIGYCLSAIALLAALSFAPIASAQPLTISTLAGSADQGSTDGSGAAARFNNPWGVCADGSGNLYVADTDNHVIRKITSGGTVATLAGLAGVSGTNDGTGSAARFLQPQGITVDALGNLYVADTGNFTIRKITSGGVVTTLAGSAGSPGSANNTGTAASFFEPEGIGINSSGTLLYVADTWNHTIRQITLPGAVVTTLAGSVANPGTNNGTGTGAQFNEPSGIAVDSAGNIYVGDTGNQMIRTVTGAGVVTTLAGSVGTSGTNDGTGTGALFWDPQGVATDNNNVFVADSTSQTIRKIVISSGVVSTLAGTGGLLGPNDGTGSNARFWQPQGVAADSSGDVFVADSANGTIRKIAPGTIVTTLAGSASSGSGDGSGANARFYRPAAAAIDSSGNAYIADSQNSTIRMVTPAGAVSTLAGLAGAFGATDGPTNAARFSGPQGIAVDGSGNIYVGDTLNHTIRKISGSLVTTLAGLAGTSGLSDGTGSNARFNYPQDVAVDVSGNVYVADTGNHIIRKVTSGGVVTTIAGYPGLYGDADGTSAGNGTNGARFYGPSGLVVDGSANVFVADTRNHAIRKITSGGVVSTLAGLPGSSGGADGTNNVARFNFPSAISLDVSGNLYVLDSGNNTIRMITLSGTTNWVVTTIAGTAGLSGSADGTGSNARFFYPAGLAINNSGAFAVADWGNNTIRAGISSSNSAPSVLTPPQPLTVNQGQNATFTVTAAGSAPLIYQWLFNSNNISGATSTSYTRVSAQPADAGYFSVLITNSQGSVTSPAALLTVIVPPTITNQPQSQTVNQYSTATFTVGATANAALSYQWMFNTTNISGATASSYSKGNVQPSDAGSYAVLVSDQAGSTNSANAVLTVNIVPTPPSIVTQPQSQSVGQGTNATFSVTAGGTTPLSYQWLFDGTNLNGATLSSYTVSSAQPANAGSYSVIVTNAYGTTNSANATLTVLVPPVLALQPVSHLASVSNSVTFSASVSQGTSPSYQWRQNGSPIAGATQSSYNIPSILWSSAGSYSVVVSNLAATVTSSNAVLVVEQAVFNFFDGFESYNLGALDNNYGGPNANTNTNPWWAFSSAGQGAVTNSGSGVTPHGGSQMSGRAVGASFQQDYINLMYRLNDGLRNDGQPYFGNFMCDWWFYDPWGASSTNSPNYTDYIALGSFFPTQTNSDTIAETTIYQRMSLGAFNATGFNVANYQARILGGSGSFGSGNSWYNTTTARTVGWHHARIVVGIPNSTYLLAPVSFYIDNMTNATVSSPVDCTNNFVFPGFTVIEVNHASSTTSGYYDDLTFRAANDPWIVVHPVSQTVNTNQSVYFNTVAVGTAYQWQFNGSNIAGATTSSYNISSVTVSNAGSYACVISGTNGTITTSNAVLTVNAPPLVTVPPSSLTVTQSQAANFTVSALGNAPLSYQWRFNTVNIAGATNTAYNIANCYATNAGSYTVVVANNQGSTTSAVATLTVNLPPSITTQPQSQSLLTGSCTTFSVTASGTAPLYYQWLYNGAPQGTFTNTATSPTECNAGTYSVIVSNFVGFVLSTNATLSFTNPATAQPGHFDSQKLLADGSLLLNMSGTPYTNYTLQFTTDWTTWNPLATLSGTNGLFQYDDFAPTTNANRFYRLVVGP